MQKVKNLFESSKIYFRLKAAIVAKNLPEEEQFQIIRQILKFMIRDGRDLIEKLLLADKQGKLCASRLCYLIDSIIIALYHLVINDIFKIKNSLLSQQISLIAVGGYGRATLAPFSDVDILFLQPDGKIEKNEKIVAFILHMLWDIGLKVSHATRTVEQSIQHAQSDMTIRTALLEQRFLCGNKELFNTLVTQFKAKVVKNTGPEFIRAKLIERDERHKKAGQTRYLVEPNVKESKGGQRDLQLLYWLTRYFYGVTSEKELVKNGIISRHESSLFKKADDFLWCVRCHIHFISGRAVERLSFDIQCEVAQRLGYTNHSCLNNVERFMKHYFLIAKQVGDLTRIISAALEDAHAKSVPGINRVFQTFSNRKKILKENSDFVIDNHRLNLINNDAFIDDPVNLIRLFYLADIYALELHPHAMQVASRSLHLITPHLRNDKLANTLFLNILTSPRRPALMLRRMNESGVLGKFIPEFGKIVAMMQFSMYHHYTVDEHLLLCVDYLSEILKNHLQCEHPLASSLIKEIYKKRHILYFAVFLHDIAKGQQEDHSRAGEKIGRKLAMRFGFNAHEVDLIGWLIKEHLTMSKVAQSRDLNDWKTITDFAYCVKTMERLNFLLILTICDIHSVGPGVLNGWKRQLLRHLYKETEQYLIGNLDQTPHLNRVDDAKDELIKALEKNNFSNSILYKNLFYPTYWLTVPLEEKLRHCFLIEKTRQEDLSFAFSVDLRSLEEVTQLIILAKDHPRLLSIVTGACSLHSANIVDAQIFTTTDGWALDTILISRKYKLDDDEIRRSQRIKNEIINLSKGQKKITELLATQRKNKKPLYAFTLKPRIQINNSLSNKFTVIEIEALDRLGLLSDLTALLSDLSLNIASAHITTMGEKIVDSFYITDLFGQKVVSDAQQRQIKRKLKTLFENKN